MWIFVQWRTFMKHLELIKYVIIHWYILQTSGFGAAGCCWRTAWHSNAGSRSAGWYWESGGGTTASSIYIGQQRASVPMARYCHSTTHTVRLLKSTTNSNVKHTRIFCNVSYMNKRFVISDFYKLNKPNVNAEILSCLSYRFDLSVVKPLNQFK